MNKKNKRLNLIYLSIIILIFSSCGGRVSFDVIDFTPFANYETNSDTLKIDFELSGTIADGISIPATDAKEQYFTIKFKIKNNGFSPKAYYYKLFYQNESYKINEVKNGLHDKMENIRANQNFYGSWLDSNTGFHKTYKIPADGQYYEITDSIRIVGNPRNEKKYFGGKIENYMLTKQVIEKAMAGISSSKEWMASIEEKAKNNNISITNQLHNDAIWWIQDCHKKGDFNNRWQRNPRVGNYSFLLVLTNETQLKKIPYYYQDITLKDTLDNEYKNPYYYFLHYKKHKRYAQTFLATQQLKVKANIDISKGIFINLDKPIENFDLSNTNAYCGTSDTLFQNAHLTQYFHNINKNYKFENIPISYDIVGNNYTQKQYANNATNYKNNELIIDYIKVSTAPGKTIGFDTTEQAVYLKNPGSISTKSLQKENVGIATRHGFTYGKFTAQIKFPEIINSDYVWNGLTCAFWLLFQDGEWNMRDICETGYIPRNIIGKSEKGKVSQDSYSEIDIEIVKTSKYWPKTSYGKWGDEYPIDDGLNNNVIITCTNWDLACHDPKEYNVGVKGIKYGDTTFYIHRWDHWYKALTSKYEYPQEKTLGVALYYQIEWQPDSIIWRIGPDKNNMKVIGYMDSKHTKIPNNQMIAVVTQEYHHASWWPTAPFNQNMIPFPLKDITGYLYDIEIE